MWCITACNFNCCPVPRKMKTIEIVISVHSKSQLLRIVLSMMDLLDILRFVILPCQPLPYYILMVTHLLPQTQSPGFDSEFESEHDGAEVDHRKTSYKTSGFSPAFYRQVHTDACLVVCMFIILYYALYYQDPRLYTCPSLCP